MRSFVADFETTTNENDCRVWAWAVCDIENMDNTTIGTDIDSFMEWCASQPDNVKVYFHNMRFDSQFIMYWLFHNNFRHVSSAERESGTFTTIISNKGMYYAIEVVFKLKNKTVKKVTFWDSYKLLPMSVEKIAKSFDLPISKLKIDYDAHNDLPVGSPISPEEEEYIKHDVKIVAYALKYFFDQGLNRMTIGSCALNEYKNLITKKFFNRYFPTLSPVCHKNIKEAYRGGYVYTNPIFRGKEVGNGIVLDINSMYPYIMQSKLLPWGTPIFFRGEYEYDDIYRLYVVKIRCAFDLKPGKLPTIQLKNSLFYTGNEYVTTSNDEEWTLFLTNVDLELFLENYEPHNLEYISGWKFRGARGMFRPYIEKWNGNKIKAREEDNSGLELLSKLFLNSLSGKFGTDTTVKEKIPYLGNDDVVHFKDSEAEERDGIYIPMSAFITSYGRSMIVNAAQKITDDYNAGRSKIQYIYSDTDSLHLLSEDFSLPEGFNIDKYELGAYKFETKFRKGKFLRAKCYIEDSTKDVYNDDPEYKLKVTVAGMPDSCKDQVNFDNFKIGATYTGKKSPKAVRGGVILETIDFTIKQ